jgi:hypothetical protein
MAIAAGGPATARGGIEPIGTGASDPAFAGGGAVAYGHRAHGGYEVVRKRGYEGHARRVRVRSKRGLGLIYEPRLAASATRVGLSLNVDACSGCYDSTFFNIFNAALVAPNGRPFTTLAGGCPERYQENGYDIARTAPPIDVWRNVVAYTTCSQAIRVRGPTGGAAHVAGIADDVRVAGSYVAAWRRPDRLTLWNWRTGAELLAVASDGEFDVDARGAIAFGSADREEVAWASPAEPRPHVLARAFLAEPRAAGGRIAYSQRDGDGESFEVRLPDGALVASAHDPTAIGPADFDGQRLAWVTRPCQQDLLVVWDGSGAVPRPDHGQCPFPRLRRGSARVDGRGRLTVEVSCTELRSLGCIGALAARDPRYRGTDRGIYDLRDYSADPGETRRARVSKGPHAICRDRHGRMRTQLVFRVYARPGTALFYSGRGSRDRTHLVTVHGARRDVRRCIMRTA